MQAPPLRSQVRQETPVRPEPRRQLRAQRVILALPDQRVRAAPSLALPGLSVRVRPAARARLRLSPVQRVTPEQPDRLVLLGPLAEPGQRARRALPARLVPPALPPDRQDRPVPSVPPVVVPSSIPLVLPSVALPEAVTLSSTTLPMVRLRQSISVLWTLLARPSRPGLLLCPSVAPSSSSTFPTQNSLFS